MSWSPSQYLQFEDERTRPVRDLLAAVPEPPADRVARVADLGCGPGNSTELLAARFPGADLVGIDNSPDMIAAARQRLPQVRFDLADIAAWQPPHAFDLLLANASLQWVPEHERLMPALAASLEEGGTLAIQMPDNLEEPAHRLMRTVAAQGEWAAALADAVQARTVLPPAGWYYDLLRPLCRRVDIWRTVYHHPLAGAPAAVEWFKGSGLRPFLQRLDEAQQAGFLARYTDALAMAYPIRADGTLLLPFPRLFIVATR
ncbi:trans-aconitate 2-methyltransferase [Cupriavidus sp. AU9028]|uniref:trans-aconitate 2-methyltransferase n=1 Tax=Cupriavidus sp. AU9028 TaxID=2871157 RepID=UPI001C9449B4|nr:trans-aconitate 2-methyltransferase [Cupriavidus sp. AU9028]MBY4895384.1 trans-aconitate 2-methyltransferase [Cupriavidus sp. AU9028]